jgi:spore germination protein KA
VLRLAVVLAAGLAGPAGLAAAVLVVLLTLAQVELLGVSYLKEKPFPAAPLSTDGVTRRNYRRLSQRPFNIWRARK